MATEIESKSGKTLRELLRDLPRGHHLVLKFPKVECVLVGFANVWVTIDKRGWITLADSFIEDRRTVVLARKATKKILDSTKELNLFDLATFVKEGK